MAILQPGFVTKLGGGWGRTYILHILPSVPLPSPCTFANLIKYEICISDSIREWYGSFKQKHRFIFSHLFSLDRMCMQGIPDLAAIILVLKLFTLCCDKEMFYEM